MILNDKVFIIAELSANHNKSLDIAKKSIKAIKDCGANAVKVQTYRPETITLNCDNEYFKINDERNLWNGETLYNLYEQAYMPWDWHKPLQKLAAELDLVFFSTPFDFSAVDYLEKLNVPIYKIASFEINDLPLIEYIAKKKKPVIISTGVGTLDEIDAAVKVCKDCGNNDIILLHCVSDYPADYENMNLKTLLFLKERYNLPIGLSDHSLGITSSIVSVGLGSKIIEKHFILDKSLETPDSKFSLDKSEFKKLVREIRNAEKSLEGIKKFGENNRNRKFMRSLFAVCDIEKGEKFSEMNIKSVRPAGGISPIMIKEIIGKTALCDVLKGTPIKFDMF